MNEYMPSPLLLLCIEWVRECESARVRESMCKCANISIANLSYAVALHVISPMIADFHNIIHAKEKKRKDCHFLFDSMRRKKQDANGSADNTPSSSSTS